MKWPDNIAEARKLQELHRGRIIMVRLEREPEYVTGVDAAFTEENVFAAACTYHYPDMTLIEQSSAVRQTTFPYVPGYLLFREGPAIMAAAKKLKIKPGLILIDGQGVAHPRGIGSASHIGVLLDIPTIGCAKTRLVGAYKEPDAQKGSWSPLRYEGKVVGAVLRTKNDVRPLFISPGHKVRLEDAIRITLVCGGRYRIPEPLRCADIMSKKLKARVNSVISK